MAPCYANHRKVHHFGTNPYLLVFVNLVLRQNTWVDACEHLYFTPLMPT